MRVLLCVKERERARARARVCEREGGREGESERESETYGKGGKRETAGERETSRVHSRESAENGG